LVCAEEGNEKFQNPAEEVFNKLVKPYLPYLADTRRFDRSNTAELGDGLDAPEMTYAVFERCMSYAVSVNWGNGNGRRPGGADPGERGVPERRKEETDGNGNRSTTG
jgi:hypothetical protein